MSDINTAYDYPLIIIINLEKDTFRKTHMEMQLKKNNILNYEFFEGVNGYDLDYKNIDKSIISDIGIDQIFNKQQRYGITLSPGGAGFYYTWYNILDKFKDNDDIIIFEDDITLSENFIEDIKNAYKNKPNDFDILYLGSHQRENIKNETNNLNSYDFIKLNNLQLNGTFSLILSKEGRRKIKEICFPAYDTQLDTILYKNFDKLNCYHINKSIAFSKNEFGSNIQQNMDAFLSFKDLEIHILICNKDFSMGMESIQSLLKYDEFKNLDIYYHDDGSLTPVQIKILKDNNFHVINKDDVFDTIENKIKNYEYCHKYRCTNKPYSFWHKIKLFDYFLLSKSKRILGLDTDILFMNKPENIIQLIKQRNSFYMPDCASSYCFNGIANTHLDGVLYSINTGIMYIDNENDYNIYLIEEGLKKIIIDDANYFPSWIEQSAFAYMFSKLGNYSILNNTKYKFPYFHNFNVNDIEALHFVSYPPCRKLWKLYHDTLKLKDLTCKKLIETIEKNVVFDLINPLHPDNNYIVKYNTVIPLIINIYELNEKYFKIDFQWKLPEDKKLDHEFKINDDEYYHYSSDYEGTFYISKRDEPMYLYHTYEWYGGTNWTLITILNNE